MTDPFQEAVGGKYEILERMREGGMGTIYKVRHRHLDEIQVIKVLRSQLAFDSKLQTRFSREAKFAAQLRHPNIAQLFDFEIDQENGIAYIVMEFIDGVSLEDVLGGYGTPSVALALECSRQCLDALEYLHQRKIIHRDVALDNFMLTKDHLGAPMIKLIDLGISKGADSDSGLTVVGEILGKAHYSPPEWFESGVSAADPRSDLYSFGVLLYRLLTAQYPIPGELFHEVGLAHMRTAPRSFAETDPEGKVPEPLRSAVLRLLEKDPADRPASAAEVRRSLAEISESTDVREELVEVLAVSRQVANDPNKRPGSTQDRLDERFPASGSEAGGGTRIFQVETTEVTEVTPAGSDVDDLDRTWIDAGPQPTSAPELPPPKEETAAGDKGSPPPDGTWVLPAGGSPVAPEVGGTMVAGPREEDYSAGARKRRAQVDQLFERATGMMESKQYETVIELLEVALAIDPKQPQAWKLLDQAREQLAERSEASEEREEFTRNLKVAGNLLAAGELDEAERLYELVAAEDAENPEVLALGQGIEAGRSRLQAERLEKERVSEIEELLRQGQAAAARSRLDAALSEFPESVRWAELDERIQEIEQKREAQAPRFKEMSLAWIRRVAESLRKPTPAGTAKPASRKIVVGLLVGVVVVAAGSAIWWATRGDGDRQGAEVEVEAPSSPQVDEPAPIPIVEEDGVLVIDAQPWAEVNSILDAEGRQHVASEAVFTPIAIPLPPGDYELELSHPPTGQVVTLTVSVESGVAAEVVYPFSQVDVRQYLEEVGW